MIFTPHTLDRLRRDTPLEAGRIHLNNAGSSIMPTPVADAVLGHLRREMAIGGYEAAAEAQPRLEALYDSLARLLNCHPDEIAFVENATRAWDMAFYSLPFKAGDRILTAEAEYASNVIAYLQMAKNRGVVLDVVPNDESGQISVEALARMIDERTKLIAISHVPSQGGLVHPAADVGRIARAAGVPFLLDACQSVGQMPVDVEALGCDMFSGTGRKFLRGPRGTGFLYVRRAWIEKLEPPFLDLHAATWTVRGTYEVRSDARRFENWESYIAGRLGLAAAADYALAIGLPAIRERVYALAARLREDLAAIPRVRVHDLGRERCGIVTFTIDGLTCAEVKAVLASERINCSVAPAEYARFDFGRRGLTDAVRVSPHYFNTDAELNRFIEVVGGIGK
jgi:selenocysteine lyase/cysteine desulfurase